MTITPGSFVGYDPTNIKNVALVVEVSSNQNSDGTTTDYALIAYLPTDHVPTNSLFPYGTDPTPSPVTVTDSAAVTATGLSVVPTPPISPTPDPNVMGSPLPQPPTPLP